MAKKLGIVVLLVAGFGCQLAGPNYSDTRRLPFAYIEGVPELPFDDSVRLVFENNEQWSLFWQDVDVEVPDLKLKTGELVILQSWGRRFSGCSHLVRLVEHVTYIDGDIEIRLGPVPDLGACRAIVNPLLAIRLHSSSGEIRFSGVPVNPELQ